MCWISYVSLILVLDLGALLYEEFHQHRTMAARFVFAVTPHGEVSVMRQGGPLVKACLEESKNLGVKRIFALTYQPEFFEKLGFKKVDKTVLPHKIWTDCLKCVKFPDCDEIAVVKELN